MLTADLPYQAIHSMSGSYPYESEGIPDPVSSEGESTICVLRVIARPTNSSPSVTGLLVSRSKISGGTLNCHFTKRVERTVERDKLAPLMMRTDDIIEYLRNKTLCLLLWHNCESMKSYHVIKPRA